VSSGRNPLVLGAVDDHPALLAGLRVELSRLDPGIRFLGQAACVPELLADGARYDVVLLDLRLQDGSRPADNVRSLLDAGCRVLVYTEGSTRPWVEEAIAAGAHGVLRKDRGTADLVDALRVLAAGDVYESAELAQALELASGLRPHLSDREREVLALYAAGMPAKSVARRLGVGVETAREYLKRIRAKYAAIGRPAYTRMEMYQRAVEDRVIDPLTEDEGAT
jgi:DNA-binding NarL/FixJ family response regulator